MKSTPDKGGSPVRRRLRRLSGQVFRYVQKLAGRRDSAARLARGVAAGWFATAFPIPGIQIPLSLLAAWVARGNKAVAILPQFISNAVTMGPQAYLQYRFGVWLWPGQSAYADQALVSIRDNLNQWRWSDANESLGNLFYLLGGLGWDILGPLTLGVVVTGLAAAFTSYPLSILFVWAWRAWRQKQKIRKGHRRRPEAPTGIPELTAEPLTRDQCLARYSRLPGMFQRAESLRLLVDGRETYPEMLMAIDGATRSIDLETYILATDQTGVRFQEALLRAVRRGVSVRLLYDYIGSLSLPDRFIRALTNAGVAVAVYNPLVLSRPPWVLNHRDHRKLLVVDQRILFTGGLNISNAHIPVEEGGEGWRDTHVRIDGEEVARSAATLFEAAWRRAISYSQTTTRAARFQAQARRRLARIIGGARAVRTPAGSVTAVHRTGNVPVQIIGNHELRYRWRIHRAYLRAIKQARRYILIENAYFIPNRAFRRALARAARRGVTVAVAVAKRSDVTLVAYATRSLYSELLSQGIRIFEWPHGMLHAKTAVIDDAWSIVGSYNFDHRSIQHQLEAVAVVADPAFARRMKNQTLADLARCREVTLADHESRSWRQMLLETAAYSLRYWL